MRIARKHVGWYLQTLADKTQLRSLFNRIDNTQEQLFDKLEEYLFANRQTNLTLNVLKIEKRRPRSPFSMTINVH